MDATEETLNDLVDQAKTMNSSLNKIVSILNKQNTAGRSGGTNNSNSEANDTFNKSMKNMSNGMSSFMPKLSNTEGGLSALGKVVGVVAIGFAALGVVVGKLAFMAGAITKTLFEFGETAAKGNMTVSQLFGVMGDLAHQIPIVGGAFAALLDIATFLIKRQEETLDVYRKLAGVGSSVGVGLTDLRMMMNTTGLTMNEFSSAIQNNSDILSTMGSDVDKGVDMFKKSMQSLMGKDSMVSKTLFGLGYTASDAADLLGLYMRTQGALNKQGANDADKNAKGAAELAKNFTALSEITGKQRKELEDQLNAQMKDKQFDNFLAGLEPGPAKDAIIKQLSVVTATMGKDAGDMFKLAIQGGPVTALNEGQQKLVVATNGMAFNMIQSSVDIAKNNKMSEDQKIKANADLIYNMAKSGQGFTDKVGNIQAILAAQGKSMTSDELFTLQTRMKGMKNAKEFEDYMAGVYKKMNNAGNSDAAKLAQQQQQIRLLGQQFDNIISKISQPFIGPLMHLSEAFLNISGKLLKTVQPEIDKLAKWFSSVIGKFGQVKSMDDFWKTVKETLSEVWTKVEPMLEVGIKQLFSAIWSASWALIGDGIVYGLKELFVLPTEIMRNSVKILWDETFGHMITGLSGMWEFIKNSMGGYISSLWEGVKKEMMQPISGIWNSIKEAGLHGVKSLWEVMKNSLVGLFSGVWNIIKAIVSPSSWIKGAFASTPSSPQNNSPSQSNSKEAEHWATEIMTGKAKDKDVPANLRSSVQALVKKPDDTVKNQVSAYKASLQKKHDDAQKAATPTPSHPSPEATKKEIKKDANKEHPTGKESKIDPMEVLNSTLIKLVNIGTQTAENTRKTASLIASNGNLFVT